MNRICPFDGDAYPTDVPGAGWDLHVRWHVTELSAEIDALTDISLWALDVDAFEMAGIIRPYAADGAP